MNIIQHFTLTVNRIIQILLEELHILPLTVKRNRTVPDRDKASSAVLVWVTLEERYYMQVFFE